MATNPNNAIGTNGAYGGRTSVNAFNDDLAIYSGRGIISGWACAPSSGLTVVLGGSGTTRDVAVAQDNAGNRTTINNISGAPVNVTLSGAPTANSRIDALVAYADNPPQGSATITDNYQACGIIAVAGTPAASPSAPTESAIRSAITADGASGSTAYYVVLATITVSTGATDIVAENITAGASAQVRSENSSPILPGIGAQLQAIEMTADATVTANQDCWLCGYVRSTNATTDAQVQIFVNDIPVAGYLHIPPTQSYFGTYISVVPVKAGDVIRGAIINGSFTGGLYAVRY